MATSGHVPYPHGLTCNDSNFTTGQSVVAWADTRNSFGAQAGHGPNSSIPPGFVRSVSSCERELEKPASGAAAGKGKSEGKEHIHRDCVQWTRKGQCPRGDKCGVKHVPEKRREHKGRSTGSPPSSSSQRNSMDREGPRQENIFQASKTSQHASLF